MTLAPAAAKHSTAAAPIPLPAPDVSGSLQREGVPVITPTVPARRVVLMSLTDCIVSSRGVKSEKELLYTLFEF